MQVWSEGRKSHKVLLNHLQASFEAVVLCILSLQVHGAVSPAVEAVSPAACHHFWVQSKVLPLVYCKYT